MRRLKQNLNKTNNTLTFEYIGLKQNITSMVYKKH